MKKRKILVLFIICLGIVYFGYKGVNLVYYHISDDFKNDFHLNHTITITHHEVASNDYLEFQNIKIRNDFKNYEKLNFDAEIETTSPKFVLKDENGEVMKAFWMGSTDTYVYLLSADKTLYGTEDKRITNTNLTNILEKNNIHDDIELFSYLSNSKNIQNNIFTNVKKMKENYAIQSIMSIIMPTPNNITLINGDYKGYIFNFENNMQEVSILKNNKRYVFDFKNNNHLTDEYLSDILGTIEITDEDR